MQQAFDPEKTDLTGMGVGDRPLFISHLIHKAAIELTEQGVEASAASAVLAVRMGGMADRPMSFLADRPFLFVLQDTQTQTILFAGKVVDPSET